MSSIIYSVVLMRRVGILFLMIIALLAVVQTASAAVDLLYFLPMPAEASILLTWETAQEIDNAGFYILRSDSQAGVYARISGFIASYDPFVGHYYEYDDTTPAIGAEYFYKLEAVDAGGNSVFYGPVPASVTAATLTPTGKPAATSTSTPAATAVSTVTPTRTATSAAASTATATSRTGFTSTPRPTTSPASTEVIGSPTATSAPTKVLTPTLEPLPEIELVFPALTPTPLLAQASTPAVSLLGVDTPVDEPGRTDLSPRLAILALVVFVLWLALVGFVVFYFHHTGR